MQIWHQNSLEAGGEKYLIMMVFTSGKGRDGARHSWAVSLPQSVPGSAGMVMIHTKFELMHYANVLSADTHKSLLGFSVRP